MISKLVYGFSKMRSGLFLLESMPIGFIQRSLSHKGQFPRPSLETLKKMDQKLNKALEDDASAFEDGVLPLGLLKPEKISTHSKRWMKILIDSVLVGVRRRSRSHKNVPRDEGLPEYYLRQFHYQTDGYLSERSASFYDHQVEILFKGTAAVMRRSAVVAVKKLLQSNQFSEPFKILDVGAGQGASTRNWAMAFEKARVISLDISSPYIKMATQNLRDLSNVDFITGKAEDLPFQNEQFDIVTSTFLHHELPREIRIQTLDEMFRVLKPGGIFVFADSLQLNDDSDLDWALQQFPLDFHEPYYADYIKWDLLGELKNRGQVIAQNKSLLTKVVITQK